MNPVNWALEHVPLLIFGFVLFSVVRAVIRAAQMSAEHKATTNETEEQKRVREIQERIRRKIAERRGGVTPSAVPEPSPATATTPPLVRRMAVPPLEPFGGPARRLVTEAPRRVVVSTPAPASAPPTEGAILERQQQLAAQMRALEAARVTTARRAATIAEENATAARETGAVMQRAGVLADLRDRSALRRAFVLREVLGAPLALR